MVISWIFNALASELYDSVAYVLKVLPMWIQHMKYWENCRNVSLKEMFHVFMN